MGLPEFNADGNLPAGIHTSSWRTFVSRFAVSGRRQKLAQGLLAAIRPLRQSGCRTLYVDGSYVTVKDVPSDYDAAWDPGSVDVPGLLLLEPLFGVFDNGRAAQKAKFGGEFFPSSVRADRAGSTFIEFFQIDKTTGNAKGIVALNLTGNFDD